MVISQIFLTKKSRSRCLLKYIISSSHMEILRNSPSKFSQSNYCVLFGFSWNNNDNNYQRYIFETMNTRKEDDGGDEIIEFDEFLKSLSITSRGTLEEKLSCKWPYTGGGGNCFVRKWLWKRPCHVWWKSFLSGFRARWEKYITWIICSHFRTKQLPPP